MSDEEDWGGVNIETFYRIRDANGRQWSPFENLDHARFAMKGYVALGYPEVRLEKVVRTYQEHVTPAEL